MSAPKGTAGYHDDTDRLSDGFERVPFETVHEHALHLIPAVPARMLDVGAGSGRDAAALAARGHRVVAVEPTAALRERAMAAHRTPDIEWLDDALPDLSKVRGRFDLILASAVWMHLDADERKQAMVRVAGLLRTGGLLLLSLRHGTVPAGRIMYDVTGDETVALANAAGLDTEMRLDNQPSANALNDARWTRLVFRKSA